MSPLCQSIRSMTLGWAAVLLAAGVALGEPLRVAFDSVVKPVAFVDENGRPAGFAADYLRAVAHEAGYELEPVAASRAQLWSEFEAGKIDVIAVLVFTEERAKTMDFSLPYLELEAAVFARKGGPALVTLADLAGRKVAVSRGNVTSPFVCRIPSGARLSCLWILPRPRCGRSTPASATPR